MIYKTCRKTKLSLFGIIFFFLILVGKKFLPVSLAVELTPDTDG